MKKINIKNSPSYRGNAVSPQGCRESSYRGNAVSRGFNCELVRGKTDGIPAFAGMTGKVRGIVENRHTAEARCPGQAKRGLALQEIFHCETMKNINVCDAVTAPAIRRAGWVPAFAGMTIIVIAALFATPSFAEPTELDKKTVASKAYVDTKQDIIETDLVSYYSIADAETRQVPSLVSYDSTNGLNGNQIGILDYENIYNDGWRGLTGSEMDNFVPTVRAVSNAVAQLNWYDSNSNALNAYREAFTNDGANNTWVGNGEYLINGRFLAKSLALKQNKIAKSGYYYNTSGTLTAYGNSSATNGWLHAGVKGTGLVTKTATEGVVGERKIFEATDVANYHATGLTQIQQDIQDISIPTVGAMMTAIANGANAALPTGTIGTVVTYNGRNAQTGVQEFGERAVYDPANAYNAQNDATKLATMASVKYECAGYEAGHENDPDYCWLWALPN